MNGLFPAMFMAELIAYWILHIRIFMVSNLFMSIQLQVKKLKRAITGNTKAIFVETPSNPLMEECDVAEIAKIAKKYNLLLIVDNTF